MTHQCLNCGKIIERGSDEILKGCQQCGGKKFIFVSSPLPQDKRMDLIKQAETVRADMVRKADPELLRVLKERGVTEVDGTTLEIEPSPTGDWLRVRPKPMQTAAQPSLGVTGPPARSDNVMPEKAGLVKPSAREIIFEFDRERLAKELPLSKVPARKKAARKQKKKGIVKPKKRVVKGGRKRAEKGKAPKKIGPPPLGTVNVIEQGVYEIDVDRLLRDDPVIIENDGTYLIHLPSMLKDGGVGKGKQKR